MIFTRDDLCIGSKVKIKSDADIILKKEKMWHSSMRKSLGKIVTVVQLSDHKFRAFNRDINMGRVMNAEEAFYMLDMSKVWTYDCIDCVANSPEIRTEITLSEAVALLLDSNYILDFIKSVKISNTGITLDQMCFRLEDLENDLPQSIIQIFHDLAYRSSSENLLEKKIKKHEEELKKLKAQKDLIIGEI